MPPGEDIQFVYIHGGKHDYVSQHNFQRWQRKFIIDLCRTVAFKLPLVTLTPTIHNTNSKNDIISFFLCSPWTSEMNLVGQANGKIISKNSCNFQNSGLLGTCTGMENSAIKVQDQEGSKSKRSLD